MSIVIQGNSSDTDVDGTTFRALRVTGRPTNYGSFGFYSYGVKSGTMASSLAANSEIFQFRWPDTTNLALVYRVSISAGSLAVMNAAALVGFRLTAARAWTVAGTGGTRVSLAGNDSKLLTNMATSLVNDIGVSTTTNLTAGTKTLDTTDLAAISIGLGTGALTVGIDTTFLSDHALYDASTSVAPLILAQNEGFVVRSGANAFPGVPNSTWSFAVNVLWAEVAVF
jgi:hypothetical protein